MTPEELKTILEKHILWLQGADGGKRADLSWANLHEADLSGADLSWADLSWANLHEADLSGADLSGAYLSKAYLSGANGVIAITRIGSRDDQCIIWVKDGILMVKTGCFDDNMDKFLAAVQEKHGDNKHARAYRLAMELAKVQLLEA